MSCVICMGPAESIPSRIDGKVYRCQDCGEYGVSGSFLAAYRGYRLNSLETRAWLEACRQENPGVTPVITTAEVALLA